MMVTPSLLFRLPSGIFAIVILATLATAVVCAPWVESLLGPEAAAIDLFARAQGPSDVHWLGTDELGRDLLVRLLHGGRVSLLVGLAGACGAATIGTLIGLWAGYAGGRIDAFLMRTTDGVLSLPLLPLLIVLAAIDVKKLGIDSSTLDSEWLSLYRIVVIVALFGWTGVARLVRGATLSVREMDYIQAAISAGAGAGRVMFVHILPNVATPLIIATTLAVGNVVLLESVLSFLGLGIQPPLPSWGNMLSNAQELIHSAPHLALYPGLLIFVTVLSVNLLGDALQATLNPRTRAGQEGK